MTQATVGSEDGEGESGGPHVVILVHGIRTFAQWQHEIREALRKADFVVELTNYEYFDAFQFLLPLPFLRRAAINKVYNQIRQAKSRHPGCKISFICHSFGTYVVTKIFRREFDLKARKLIFCGSVVRTHFPFERFSNQFEGDVLNEVGNADYWPVLARTCAWGYSPTGSYGFRRPYVNDRWHKDLRHSDFLNQAFCEKFWIPFLKDEPVVSGDAPVKPPWWVRILSVVQVKYILLVLILFAALVCWMRAKDTTYHSASYIGGPLSTMRAQIEEEKKSCMPFRFYEWLRGRRCVNVSGWQDDVVRLVISRPFQGRFSDPVDALYALADLARPCIIVTEPAPRQVTVSLDSRALETWQNKDGDFRYLCDAAQPARATLRRDGWFPANEMQGR